MVVMSARTLAAVFVLVVMVSLAGSMLGYALGTLRHRTDAAATSQASQMAALPVTSEENDNSSEPAKDHNVSTGSEGISSNPTPASDTTTDLPVGQAASRNGVTLTLEEATENPWQQGLEVRFTLANASGKELRFLFTPESALAVEDSRGARFNLRWAEYAGEVRVPDGEQVQLIRALYEGQLQHPGVDQITVAARDVPGVGQASWRIPVEPPDQPSTTTQTQ